ncbi:MAG: C39 family peptidase [Candidatus Krumholzibacteriia bacterium]
MVSPRAAIGIWAALAVLGWAAATAAGPSPPGPDAPEQVSLLDVPYVPQSGSLCGGAALAMVLRYWGETGVLAEDFASLVEADQDGIRTRALVDAVAGRGWTALILPAATAAVAGHVHEGRPVIALLQVGADSYHYVVLVAWAGGRVILHDPNVGPFRAVREAAFEAAWSGSGNWALLVLPPQESGAWRVPDHVVTAADTSAVPDACSALVERGILLAAQQDTAGAEHELLAAQALCPASAVPLRERAGLRFNAGDWAGATRLAERALALDPDDAHAWRLLAGSRFLADDVQGALHAWNHLSEPRNDLTRVDGLARTRYSAVATQLDLPPGRLLTPGAFRRAGRRLAELPAQTGFRLGLRPLPDGVAQVDAKLLERPLVAAGRWDIVRAGTRALVAREVGIDVASPTGNGELWTGRWRWWQDRPRLSLTLAVPAAGGRPGIWTVDGSWERQTYVVRARSGASGASAGESIREERRRTALSFADWFGPDLRLALGAAFDAWDRQGAHLALEGSVETRWLRDRLAASVAVARWTSLDGGVPFAAGGVSFGWGSGGLTGGDGWRGRAGLSSATADAPLALWSGAGTGYGRAPLLRAHPLLDGGVIEGRVFGRTLAHATIERQVWPWRHGPVQFGWAVFVDGARPWHTGRAERVPWQVDGGLGLRLRSVGLKGQLRIDVAHGFTDGHRAGSVAWESAW